MKKPLPLDYVIMAAILILSLIPLLLVASKSGDTVRVEQDGKTLYVGSVHTDHVVIANGNTVTILDGQVTVTAADCRDGLCMHGTASATHPLVCLPNRLVVTIEDGEVTPDAVTY